MSNQNGTEILLYHPKALPVDLLNDISGMLRDFSCIGKAYYCMGSMFIDSELIEINLIGIEITHTNDRTELMRMTNFFNEFSSRVKNVNFVSADEAPFASHFANTDPFYKK